MERAEYNNEHFPDMEDNTTIFIVGSGSFDSATTENSLIVLSKAIQEYGKPRDIMTYHRKQFFSNGKNGNPGEPNGFHRFLHDQGIRHILAGVKHPHSDR